MTDLEKMEKMVTLVHMYSWMFQKSGWFQYLDYEKKYGDRIRDLKWRMFQNGTDKDAVTMAQIKGKAAAKQVCKGRVTVKKAEMVLALVDKLVGEVRGA